MNPTPPKLNISTITTNIFDDSWSSYPGKWIAGQSLTPKAAEIVFKQFITKKIPAALNLIQKLNNTQHLSANHLPLDIYTIFLIYITEQIELYQNQMDERDLALDEMFLKFKEAFAKGQNALFVRNSELIKTFFNNIRALLVKEDVLPKDFDQTLSVWLEIIGISHIGSMNLSAFFDPEAKTTQLFPEKTYNMKLPRSTLEASFFLMFNQFSMNFKDIARFKDKMGFSKDIVVQKLFCTLVNKKFADFLPKINIIHEMSLFPDRLQELLKMIAALDLTNSEQIEACRRLLEIEKEVIRSGYKDLSEELSRLEKLKPSDGKWPIPFKTEEGTIQVSEKTFEELFLLFQNRHECGLFFDAHLLPGFLTLGRIFESVIASNKDIETFNKEGILPPCNPKIFLPSPTLIEESSIPKYNENIFRELYTTPVPETGPIKKRKKKQGAKVQPVTPQKTQKEPALPTLPPLVLLAEPPQAAALDPLEQLRRHLLAVYHTQPSIAIRQAVWHLEALITLKGALQPPAMKENLTVLNLAAGSAHKLLEQTYRFCLANRNIQPLSCHNLKNYERALGNSSFPHIVHQLYFGDHWTRYFYPQKQKWTFSTQVVNIPTLLQDLVDTAEGKVQGKNATTQKALDIIEKTRAYVETMLPQLNIALPLEYLAEDVAIQPKLRFSPGEFNKVKTELTTFLTESRLPPHHLAYLHIKQAIAALNILKGGLQAVQGAKTPRELATWLSLCVQQVHETLENVLCGIEALREGQISSQSHNLKNLASKLGLEMGELAAACDHLSYKSRYPAENLIDGLGAQIIDDAEALRQVPGYLEGFKVVGKPPLLWKQLEKDPTLVGVMDKLCTLLKSTKGFLEMKAVPALKQR